MEATLAALEAPAPPPVTRDPPAAKQGMPQAPVEPLQPSTSARVNSHKDTDSGGMRTRSRAQREPSPNGTDTVRFLLMPLCWEVWIQPAALNSLGESPLSLTGLHAHWLQS